MRLHDGEVAVKRRCFVFLVRVPVGKSPYGMIHTKIIRKPRGIPTTQQVGGHHGDGKAEGGRGGGRRQQRGVGMYVIQDLTCKASPHWKVLRYCCCCM